MSLTISMSFLSGRAHLHPWLSHHNEGRVEWPPSVWRLLRAIVAVAGRGLTFLPAFDSYSERATNPRENLGTVLPEADSPALAEDWAADCEVGVPLPRLMQLLSELSSTPNIFIPKTGGGHTRQYFPTHESGRTKNTGTAVFDSFITIARQQPLLFYWKDIVLDTKQLADLRTILSRMTYFGRAESWSAADAHPCEPGHIKGIVLDGIGQTHWRCVCLEEEAPRGNEYVDYTLERRLAPLRVKQEFAEEVVSLFPRTKTIDGKTRAARENFAASLQFESSQTLLLRCLLRESGQDIRDGLERPIGTRWVHYAVPREVYNVPCAKVKRTPRRYERVNLVRYGLNTATVHRPVLPPITDTLLVADRFRSALMALHPEPSRNLSGHEPDGTVASGRRHAHWWPVDEDNDGFIDHVMVWAPDGFEMTEIDALRRLTRLHQRGGRPDLYVTPTFVGEETQYTPWTATMAGNGGKGLTVKFVSATPYFCPVHLSHGRGSSGRSRPITPELLKGLKIRGEIEQADEIRSISEIIFDYAPPELVATNAAISRQELAEPVPPRQFFPVIQPPREFPPLPFADMRANGAFKGAFLKNPDDDFSFGVSIGLTVEHGNRFIRSAAFCRRRRQHQTKGPGRMFYIEFSKPRAPRPFAIGDQCHFGLGLFVPLTNEPDPD